MPKRLQPHKLDALADAMAKELIAKGLLIEAGFFTLRHMAMAPDAPQIQVDEMRMAFFAGAQHLHGTMMRVFDPGDEPTAADLKKMDQIDDELQRFIRDFNARFLPTKGSA